MNTVIDKKKLIESIGEKINYLTVENRNSEAKELKELLYVINKGCFDKKYNASIELDTYIKENSEIWDLTDTKKFLLYHRDNVIEILQKL